MFAFGFAYSNLLNNQELSDKVWFTCIGDIFFKSDKPKELKEWYKINLGLKIDENVTNFEWYQGIDLPKSIYPEEYI